MTRRHRQRYQDVFKHYRKSLKTFPGSCYGSNDETYFSLRVYEYARILIEQIGRKCNRSHILLAALVHDVGKVTIDITKVFSRRGERKDALKEYSFQNRLYDIFCKDLDILV